MEGAAMPMRGPRLIIALTLAGGLGLGGCGATTGGPAVPTGGDSSSPTTEELAMTPAPDDAATSPGARGLPLGPVTEDVVTRPAVQSAIADAAERSGVPESEVEVAGYADVTWSDGSLGCPRKGMVYTMALVPGHQLILQVGAQTLSYHAANGGNFSFCASPQPPSAAEGSR